MAVLEHLIQFHMANFFLSACMQMMESHNIGQRLLMRIDIAFGVEIRPSVM